MNLRGLLGQKVSWSILIGIVLFCILFYLGVLQFGFYLVFNRWFYISSDRASYESRVEYFVGKESIKNARFDVCFEEEKQQKCGLEVIGKIERVYLGGRMVYVRYGKSGVYIILPQKENAWKIADNCRDLASVCSFMSKTNRVWGVKLNEGKLIRVSVTSLPIFLRIIRANAIFVVE